MDSAGSDFDEWMESVLDGVARWVSEANGLPARAEVPLDVELGRTISTFHKSAQPEASSVVAAMIDGEELRLSDDEDSVPDEPEPEPEAERGPYVSGAAAMRPRFHPARLKAAVEARSNPVWERSTKNGGSGVCMWCDQVFSPTCWRYHCRRCGWAVCDSCSPHRLILDTWLEYEKPHAVRHDVSDSAQRVCDGCARAAHEPAAAPVFYLATISRISDQTSVVRCVCIY